MPAGDVVAAHRSQPEFDFEDEEDASPVTAATVPATTVASTEPARNEPARSEDEAAAFAAQEVTTTRSPEPEIAMDSDADNVEPVNEDASSLEGMIDQAAGESQPPFALEPATMAPAETAAVGTPDTTRAESPVAPGLFDGADASAPTPAEPAEAAALAVAEQTEREDRQSAQP